MTGLRQILDRERKATGLPLGRILALAAVLHLVVAVVAVNPWHPDEHFQILEFAWARSGLAPLEALPWEFAARIRATLQPTLALGLLQALRALGVTSPFPWMFVLRLGTLVLALGVMVRSYGRVAPGLTAEGRRVLWLSGLLLWFMPLFLFRFSSENLSGLALVAALPLVEETSSPNRQRDVGVGILLGAAFLFRFQTAFAIAGLLAWLALRRPGGGRRAIRVVLGAAAVVAAGTVVDRWFYGVWVFTPWTYFHANVVEGVANSFGTSPWYAYLVWPPLWMAPPLGLAVAGLIVAGIASRPGRAWTWAFVAFLAGHMAVPHKELRFLFPLLLFVPVFLAWGSEALIRRVSRTRWLRAAGWLLAVQNLLLLALALTPAVYHGREFDGHYLRWLWNRADEQPSGTVYVLQDEGSAIRSYGLDANVYRHPRVVAVEHPEGTPIPSSVPEVTPPQRLLLLSRGPGIPSVEGATVEGPVYQATPGYRTMLQRPGWEHSRGIAPFLTWLDRISGWQDAPRARKVFQVDIQPRGH